MIPSVEPESAILKSRLPVTAVVLTFNEESNLDCCLASLDDWAQEVFVVDSGSTDQTVDIAKRHGAVVAEHAFESHAQQWQWALRQLPQSTTWVLALDADQRITSELKSELAQMFQEGYPEKTCVQGFYISRRQMFQGRWIRHGGYYPKYLLKLFRRDAVVFDELDFVDHHFYIKGPTAKLKYDLVEENHKEHDITFWTEKHNRYAVRMAAEQLKRKRQPRSAPIRARWMGSPDERTMWLKNVWFRLPLYLRPILYFIYRYFVRLGFLDGKQGFIFHFLQAFWFRLLVDIILDEGNAGQTPAAQQPTSGISSQR